MSKEQTNKATNLLDQTVDQLNKPNIYHLTELELLKIKNLQLQRIAVQKELNLISLQEEIIVKMISDRVGENIANWQFDLEKAVVTRRQP